MSDYPSEEYTDEEEVQDNYIDEQRENWEESGGNYPSANKPESLFSLFKDVWRTKDSSKVANLNKAEVGDLGMSVRACQDLSLFAKLLGHKGVNKYFRRRGEIILATSMSRDMRFAELFISTKKFAHKSSAGNKPFDAPQSKWRIFGERQKAQDLEEA